MTRAGSLAALALAACAGIAAATTAPGTADYRTASFVCPPAATTNVSCACTSGCSINSEFSYLWSSPVYPPPTRWLGSGAEPRLELPPRSADAPTPAHADTICGVITLPCTAKAADLGAYLGINGCVGPPRMRYLSGLR